MALTGTAKGSKKAVAPAAPTIRVKDLLDQMDREWTELRLDWGAEASDPRNTDEAGLLSYFHSCMRPLVQLINGNPYTLIFPQGYIEAERFPKLCAYLTSLQDAEPEKVAAARELNLRGLRAAWPAYRDLNQPEIPNGSGDLLLEVPPYNWAGLESGWNGENDDPYRERMLPTFAVKASADFHLAALAVLFLNRQLRRKLTDLTPQGGN